MKPCVHPDFYSLQEGYPYKIENGRKIYIVREILEQKLGRELVKGELALHSCNHRGCLEPEHIYLGSSKERGEKMVERGTQSKGSSRPKSKLTESDVQIIYTRLDAGEVSASIAKDYDVNKSQISRIKNGRTWNHVERQDYD